MSKHYLYNSLIAPHSKDPNARNQEMVLNWLLAGSLGLTLVAFLNDLFSFCLLRDRYVLSRLLAISGLLVLFAGLLALSRRRQQQVLPSIVLVSILFASAFWVSYHWDIITPTGVLLFSLIIVIAGILLKSRSSLYMALLTIFSLSALEFAKSDHYIHPDLSWQGKPSSFTDVAGFSAIYAILALSSWLFNGQMERALSRAQRSEKALKRQRDLLEVKVEQRTRQLQAAQLEQIQEVYRFAELGHLSTALFHDMANHLASVSIDIKGLRQRQDPHSDISSRIQENINYINEVVKRVRRQVQGQTEIERFNVVGEINEIIKILAYQSKRSKVVIELHGPPTRQPLMYRGDLTRFRQLVINLLSNGLEAYHDVKLSANKLPIVAITAARSGTNLQIMVADHGKGIKVAAQSRVFEPFYSTKDKGMGIGLFIVKQVTEKDFGGTIDLSSDRAGTKFIVTLPLKRDGRQTT